MIAGSIQVLIGGRGCVRASADAQSDCDGAGARPLSRTNLTKTHRIVLVCGIYSKLVREEGIGSDIKSHWYDSLRGI